MKIGEIKIYRNGTQRIVFQGQGRDWFAFNEHTGTREFTVRTRRELAELYRASDNTEGAYGCARLMGPGEDE